MKKSGWIVLLAFALALVSAPAFAQSSNATSLKGIVVDKDGGVVPGATVVVKNNATGTSLTTTTNKEGLFQFPSLDAGSYNVKISLQSFKTVENKDVRLLSATPGDMGKTVLEIGAMTDMVEVHGTTDLIRSATPTVSNTVTGELIESLPRNTRNALDFTIYLPGVQTGGNGGSQGSGNSRASTIAGLPQNTINITMDGIVTSNMLQTGDGFFTMVTPRLDAVEEVTLTTAAAGADSSGQGATQIRFVTRSGTNQYQVSFYDYWQNKMLNTNTFFQELAGLPRVRRTINVYGGRIGGPIVIPGLIDGHGKAFFFFNQENNWQPNQTTRIRTIALDSTMTGQWTYNATTPVTTNVLTVAANTGNITAIDPTVLDILTKISAVSKSTGTLQTTAATPNFATFRYLESVASIRISPTARVDVNLTPHHRLSGSYYLQRYKDNPDTLNNADPAFPGFPAQAAQNSYRTTGSSTLRSTFGTNIVNELLVGWQVSPNQFFTDATNSMFSDPAANTKGYYMVFNGAYDNPQPGAAQAPQPRDTSNLQINDSVNWLKGNHSFKFGAEFTRLYDWAKAWNTANQVTLGLSTNPANNDPALAMFTTVNFPTANTTDLNNMRDLYSMLTGRVSSLPGSGRLLADGNTYQFNGQSYRKETQDEWGFFAQDSWRLKPNVTISAGLRYEIQMSPIRVAGGLSASTITDLCGMSGVGAGPQGRPCNMFQPGTLPATQFAPVFNPATNKWDLNTAGTAISVPSFYLLTPKTKGYALDLNNLAPSVGINWRPTVKAGFLRHLLGDPEAATVTGAFARNFNHERLDQFLNTYNNGNGSSTNVSRGFGNTSFLLNPLDQDCFNRLNGTNGVTAVPGTVCTQNANPLLFSQTNLMGGGDPLDLTSGPAYTFGGLGPLTTPLGISFVPTLSSITGGTGAIKSTTSSTLRVFDPNIQVPYTDSWTVGLQRSLGRDMAFEVRYLGNKNYQAWQTENLNQVNYRETGLLGPNMAPGFSDPINSDQFLKAEANLLANVAAGRGATFKYFGAGTGTSPLPLFLNHFSGSGGVQPDATDPAQYTSTQWTSSTWTTPLNPFNPNPSNVASNLATTAAFQVNAINSFNTTGAPGIYPTNFWQMNPAVSSANLTRNLGTSKYNSMTLDLRRRFSKGFQSDLSYTYARGTNFNNNDPRLPLQEVRSSNIPHAIKGIWVWDLPIGRGRRFGTNMNGVLNTVIGGWQFSGTTRIQVPLLRLTNTLIFGMSQADAQKMVKNMILVRDSTTGVTTVRDMPQDVIDNTIKAYNGSGINFAYFPISAATFNAAGAQLTAAAIQAPTGRFFAPAIRPAGAFGTNDPGCFGLGFSGDCAPDMFFYGKWFAETDMMFLKKFQLPHKVQFEMDVEIFNAFNSTNFRNNLNPGSGSTIFRVTNQDSGTAGAGRTGQLLWRVSW